MNISPINCQPNPNSSPEFKANLWVDASVKKIVKNTDRFEKAAKNFDSWLKHDQAHVNKTMYIRENTSLFPNIALERAERKQMAYTYPHEDSVVEYEVMDKKYEDLEFEMGGRKCGFWLDPWSNSDKLLSDFKNMFNFLNK